MSIVIRRMTTEDLDGVMEIEVEAFPTPWPREAYEKEITKNDLAYYVVAESDGRIVGYAGLWEVVGEGHITNVAVRKERRGEGISNLLMEALLERVIALHFYGLTLEVRVSNTPARSLYEKFGFESVGVRKSYYSDNGEDAVVMWRVIRSEEDPERTEENDSIGN